MSTRIDAPSELHSFTVAALCNLTQGYFTVDQLLSRLRSGTLRIDQTDARELLRYARAARREARGFHVPDDVSVP